MCENKNLKRFITNLPFSLPHSIFTYEKDSNYQRYNQSHQPTINNHNNAEKYDSAGNSTANSVSPPSNSTNATVSPSNLASPNSPSNVSSNNASSTNVSSSNANQEVVSSTNSNDSISEDKQISNDDQVKVVAEQESPPIIETTNSLARDLSNLQLNTNQTLNQGAKKPHHSIEKSTPVPLMNHPNQTMSFKSNNGGGYQSTYVNSNLHHVKSSHSPGIEPSMVFGGNNGLTSTKSGLIYATGKSVSSTHNSNYNNGGTRNPQSNKLFLNSYPNNLSNNNGGYSSYSPSTNNKMYTSSFPRNSGSKKSQHPNAHLLNSTNHSSGKTSQTINQSIAPNAGGYSKMNPMAHQPPAHSMTNKMIPNPNLSVSQGHHQMIPTHPPHVQMIAQPNGYPIFYSPNNLNHPSSQTLPAIPNMHHPSNMHLPQNCIQCQYYNGQFMPANTYPAQFLAFPPYQYNQQSLQAAPPLNLPSTQPRQYGDDPQMKRSNQSTSNSNNQATTQQQANSAAAGNNNMVNNSAGGSSNKYAQQQDHIAAPNHMQPARFAYNPYMPIHAIPPNYYYPATNNAYIPGHNESQPQLNAHMISNSSAAMFAQQHHQLQLSIVNNLQQHQQPNQLIMNPSSEQFAVGIPSNAEANNLSAGNSRSNSTNYDAAGNILGSQAAGQNGLQTAPQANGQVSFDSMSNGKFYSNYITANNALADYNQQIWPQQQNPNLLMGNSTASNTTGSNVDDFLSSHGLTNSNKTNTYSNDTASSNFVNPDSTGLLVDKK